LAAAERSEAALCLSVEFAKADFTFGKPTNLGPIVNSSASEWGPNFSADYLEMFFVSDRPGGFGDWDIWVTTRETTDDDWGTPLNLGAPVNSSFLDSTAAISPNGLELYFSSTRPGGIGHEDIWVTRRESKDNPWGPPVNLGQPANSSTLDYGLCISADGLELYFNSMRPGGVGSQNHDLYVMRRATISDDWGAPVNLGPVVNGPSHDISPSLSADGRYLFFSDHPSPYYIFHAGGFGLADIWVTTRATIENDWGEVVNLGPIINTSGEDCFPRISPNDSTLYFVSDLLGGYGQGDIYQAPIIPIVDFNGDEIVDSADMCIMVDHWGENYRLCDIGPTALGDGVVDVEDLKVLAEHLFEEVFLIELVGYWKLDQTEGNIAHNSAGFNDGICHGEPLWQPTDGRIGGALQFDGIDDYVDTDFVLNPVDGPFSAFAWIKGGAAGQVIISQADTITGRTIKPGSVWLGIGTSDGKLLTTLTKSLSTPLISDSIITDGQWHHVGIVLVESGTLKFRTLYLDGEMVAFDAQTVVLLSLNGGIRIGAGNSLDAETFFSGLIDDVRIYNVALTPKQITELAQ
jgi:Tol biopolymer transport system component